MIVCGDGGPIDDDGVKISMNVYRPKTGEKVPVIIAFTSYGKDMLPETENYVWSGRADGFRKQGEEFGDMRIEVEKINVPMPRDNLLIH